MPASGCVIVQPFQLRMARAALGWTIEELAEYAGIGERTVRRMENKGSGINLTVATYQRIVRCFEESGITFMEGCNEGRGAGVCFTES